mgnify:CR=1 FL=1
MWAYQVLDNLNSFGGKLDRTILQAMLSSFNRMVKYSEIKLNPMVEDHMNYFSSLQLQPLLLVTSGPKTRHDVMRIYTSGIICQLFY